jgi:protein O-mannosyl-transferase
MPVKSEPEVECLSSIPSAGDPTATDAAATVEEPVTVSRPPAGLFLSHQRRSMVLCLLLALLTLAFYNNVVHNGFTNFDDDLYVVDNAHVRAGLTWDTVKWAFTSRDAANWHPLTWISHALDCQLFGLNPAGPHYVNVLFHAGNAILLFLLLEGATGLTWPSFVVAALFALHPVNVESVAWAAERKNVLSMFFFLLTLHAYGWYVRRSSARRYAVVAALFALGLMAKPEVITLPFVLLLWDYWPLRRMDVGRFRRSAEVAAAGVAPRSFRFLLLEKVPLLMLSAGSAVITVIAQRGGHAVRTASSWVRFGNALVAYVRYIGKAFWPSKLAALYPHLGRFLPHWEIIGSAALLILLSVLILCSRRDYAIVGWFWFLGTLVPVIGLVQVGVQAMADRYAYLSFIGLFICVAWGAAEIARRRKIPAVWMALPVILILTAFGMITRHQIGYWRDSETLWKHTLSVTEQNYVAHDALARAFAKQGRIDEAIAEHNAAEALHAYAAPQFVEIGVFEQTHGHVKDAIAEFERAVDAAEDSKSRAVALSCLGSAFLQAGDVSRAKMSYGYALREDAENVAAMVGSGLLAERDGNFAYAVAQISHAMKAEPSDVGYLLLAQALRRAGDVAGAEDATAQAGRISHDVSAAQRSAAEILAQNGIRN